MRVRAAEVTRAYITTPGWKSLPTSVCGSGAGVRVADVLSDRGTVIAIAEWDRPAEPPVAKLAVANTKESSSIWQSLTGEAIVPAGVTRVRLRLGLSYAKGASWWRDIALVPSGGSPFARILPMGDSTPAICLSRC